MNTQRLSTLRIVLALLVGFGAITLSSVSADEVSLQPSNRLAEYKPPQRWLSLKEVLAKWDGTSMTEILDRANQGDLTAQHYLGYAFAEGRRTNQVTETGIAWYRKAAESGYVPSFNNLGVLYESGKGVPKDLTKARSLYQIAAERGFPQAQFNLGVLYRDGVGVGHDRVKARDLFARAAEGGHAGAMLQLYFIFSYETGTAQDRTKAREWLFKSAEAGNAHAQCISGIRLESPSTDEGEVGSMPKAVYWYRKSAEQDWAGGQYYLGLCYLSGKGVEMDEERGLELIRAAADKRHTLAMYWLAKLYKEGIGSPRSSEDRPVELLQRIALADWAERERSWAFWEVIYRHEHGFGAERNLMTAVRWYCRAVAAGIDDYSLKGKTEYTPGRPSQQSGRPLDSRTVTAVPSSGDRSDRFLRALSFYLKSARGDSEAPARIGEMYLIGESVPRNYGEAQRWFSLAQKQGNRKVVNSLAECQAHLAAEEIGHAEKGLLELEDELRAVKKEL